MATKIERCNYCGRQLLVSLGAQAVRCPVCQSVTHVPQTYNAAVTKTSTNAYYPTAGVVGYGYYPPQTPPPPPVYGRKRAVLCGVSYRGQQKSLNGSVNDVMSMKSFLVRRGFPHASILVLTEDDPLRIPTRHNMQWAMDWLVQGCQSGDSLVFYYTGHGSSVPNFNGDERDGYDEALCPVDYMTAGKILDDEINARIVRPLPRGVKLHAMIDTCHSGTVLDLPFLCRMNQNGYYEWEDQCPSHTYKGTYGGRALSFSACDDHQNSFDTTDFTGNAASALTISFLNAVESQPTLTYGHLLTAMRYNIFKTRQGIGLNGPFASPHSQVASRLKGLFGIASSKINTVVASANNYPSQAPSYVPQQIRPPSLVAPVSRNTRRRAVLCGVSYYGTRYRLKSTINDIRCMQYFLVEKLGFQNDSIFVLSDRQYAEEETNPSRTPTKHNIQMALQWLVQGCCSGDSLVFHYSGHGSQQRDLDGDEMDGYDETLWPVDHETAGPLLDDEINAIIVRPLPHGAKLHAIIDSCHSGTVLDLPFLCRMNLEGYYLWEDHSSLSATYKGTSGGLAISFSACDDHQVSVDTTDLSGNTATGAMTYSFIQAVQNEPGLTYGGLLNAMRYTIRDAKTGIHLNGPIASLVRKVFHRGLSQ
ncbi:hypothetical protein RJ639_022324, partial [Escallonia herrerae]